MRVLKKVFDPSGGEVTLAADVAEDLWHVHNLLRPTDALTATTWRKINKESPATGAVESARVKLNMTLRVTRVEFDPEAAELRVSGTTLSEHAGVRLGSAHTFLLELHRPIRLRKPCWDSVALEQLAEAEADPATKSELAVVLMQQGLATLCHVTDGMSLVRGRCEASIPRRGSAAMAAAAVKALERWREQVLATVLRCLDFERVKCVVLAGPGFVKDDFASWMWAQAEKRALKPLLASRPAWLLVHASSAYKHSLKEVLADVGVAALIADTRAAGEVRALNEFYALLSLDGGARVAYGYRHVQYAAEQGALDRLLLSDSLFRAQHVARRAQYVDLVETARQAGAQVHIFSSMHISGDQLAKLSGVAATLRFPLQLEWEEGDDDVASDDDICDDNVRCGGGEC